MPLPMWLTWVRWSMSCSRSRPCRHTLPPLFRPRLESLEGRWLPSTFVVVNTDNAGAGSLRQAILDANATPGTNEINFDIGGGGAQTIRPTWQLPDVSHSVVIDGTTQPGFAGSPLIDLDGTNGYDGMNGLIIASDSLIRGLAFTHFAFPDDPCTTEDALIIAGSNNVVQGNYIGTDLTGTVRAGNSIGLSVMGSNNRIGGTTAAERNLISGNDLGVNLFSNNNVMVGNYVGTDVTGAHALGNGLGVNVAGANNLVGGTTAEARNLISGNDLGIEFFNAYGTSFVHSNRVQGNYIGTDVTGTHALFGFYGLTIRNGSDNLIGGADAGAGNLISGNLFTGLTIASSGNLAQGNRIGTDVTGGLALANGLDGVQISSASNNLIGGTEPGAGNLISGNGRHGVFITNSDASGVNFVQGNLIGTDVTGAQALSNGRDGIHIDRSMNNTVGGEAPGASNFIAFNGNDGVLVDRNSGNGATGNAILGNAIFANANLGIELLHGANHDQAAPVITSATTDNTSITVTGTLTTTPNTTFTLEFFASDPSGLGQRFVGSVQVTTDADGNASFTLTFTVAVDPGWFLTATATDAANNTSRFSDPVELTG